MGVLTLSRLRLGLLAAVALPLAVGCHTTKKVSLEIHETLFTATPQPASSLGCMWKKQIAHLPDPTRNGVLAPGIVGMMNLYAADGLPTKADGDLQVMAYDETPRGVGQAAGLAEMWHFDAATLKKKLATKDDRGMDCYALFLPWPKAWADVTKVRLQAKYTPRGGGPELSANDPPMSFEFAATPGGGTGKNTLAKGGPAEMRGMPDLKQIFNKPAAGVEKEPIVAAAATQPMPGRLPAIPPAPVMVAPTPVTPEPSAIMPSAAMQLPANAPQIVTADPTPMPMPVPPPPPAMPKMVTVVPVSPTVKAVPTEVKPPENVFVTVGEGLPDLVIPAAK